MDKDPPTVHHGFIKSAELTLGRGADSGTAECSSSAGTETLLCSWGMAHEPQSMELHCSSLQRAPWTRASLVIKERIACSVWEWGAQVLTWSLQGRQESEGESCKRHLGSPSDSCPQWR